MSAQQAVTDLNAEYTKLKEKFELIKKKIFNYETRPLPTEEQLREERVTQYKTELVEAYNLLVSFIDTHYPNALPENKTLLNDKVTNCKASVLRALTTLSLETDLPDRFELIDINKIFEAGATTRKEANESASTVFLTQEQLASQTTDERAASGSKQVINPNTEPIEENLTNTTHIADNQNETNQANNLGDGETPPNTPTLNNNRQTQPGRPMEKSEYIKLLAATIRVNYAGDPLALAPFVASIELMKEMADGNANLLTLLRRFILAKLEGYAAEVIPAEVASIDEIVNNLKAKIKPESSKVIEGRMMALRADRSNLQDYCKKAEELADALRRSLVIDGIPLAKAEEMTIDKTVELCRANAQNNVVKSVLASTKFTNPKEVIAKFVIESNTTKQEAQVFALRKFQSRQDNNRNRNSRQNNRNGRNFQNNQNNNSGNGQNRNRNGRFNNNRQNNNNGHWRQNNQNGSDNVNNNNRNNNNNSRNFRRVENATAPQSTMGQAGEN